MQTFYFEAGTGRCLGSFGSGTALPPLAQVAAAAPSDGRQVWNGSAWAWPIDAVRSDVLAAIAARYLAALAGGLAYAGKVLQIREADQANLTAMGNEARWAKAAGAAWPPDFAWRMADDSFLALPMADAMIALGEAAKAEVYRLRQVKWSHVDAVRALSDAADVAAYNFQTGW
ncbi:MAG: DUF4376 domain-containing protein [Rhodospirillaceae bacterium]|nr:DUF4376 domain-containing protein [Rhodospirillaceae bacterium]